MADDLLREAVYLDLETHIDGTLLAVGAIRGETTFSRGSASPAAVLADLDRFCHGASALVGHNISRHDLPVLKKMRPDLALLKLPLVDTLILSPLAFPENPYHRLLKDYKLVSSSRNDPVADARLSKELLREEVESFLEIGAQNILLTAFYAHAFARAGAPYATMAPLFGTESVEANLSTPEALALLFSVAEGRVCPEGLSGISDLSSTPLFWPSAEASPDSGKTVVSSPASPPRAPPTGTPFSPPSNPSPWWPWSAAPASTSWTPPSRAA